MRASEDVGNKISETPNISIVYIRVARLRNKRLNRLLALSPTKPRTFSSTKISIPTAQNPSTNTMYQRIGQGFCGTVWSNDDIGDAIKREDGGPGRSLQNDFIIHRKVLSTIKSITVPNCYQYISASDPWWDEHICKFPNGYQVCNALISERIPPFRNEARTRIIDSYCPESLRAAIKQSGPDRDCLIRPYLGRRRRRERHSRFQAFQSPQLPPPR